MSLSAFHRYSEDSQVTRPADFKERVIAQLIDGIILGVISAFWLAIYSNGQLYSVWVSPMVPFYLIQVVPEFTTQFSDWWWGGYFITISLPVIADLHIAYPSLVFWLLYGTYYTWFHAFYGQTPGKMMKGLVVLTATGEIMSLRTSLARWLGYLLSILPVGIGIFVLLKKNSPQTYHDLATQTRVSHFK
jgi:uncharacterized RDD family membrane protein YckC